MRRELLPISPKSRAHKEEEKKIFGAAEGYDSPKQEIDLYLEEKQPMCQGFILRKDYGREESCSSSTATRSEKRSLGRSCTEERKERSYKRVTLSDRRHGEKGTWQGGGEEGGRDYLRREQEDRSREEGSSTKE